MEFLVDSILVTGCFSNLLIHQYGNYFCQKLFPRLTNEQKLKLWKELELDMPNYYKPALQQVPSDVDVLMSKFLWIASNPKGTHSLQVFIETLESPEFKVLISALFERENPLYFAFNKHATHVLIKYIELTTENPFLTEIYNVVTNNFCALSMDSNGLPLVKKCLAWIRTPALKANMIRELPENATLLA